MDNFLLQMLPNRYTNCWEKTEQMPSASEPILNDLGFYMHDGGHGLDPTDWNEILDFIQKYL